MATRQQDSDFVASVLRILDEAPVRRTTQEAASAQAEEIARLLLAARRECAWQEKHRHQSLVTVGVLRTRKGNRRLLLPTAAELLPEIKRLRGERDRAAAAWRQAKKRGDFLRGMRARARLFLAGERLQARLEQFNYRRTGLPEPPVKHHVTPCRGAVFAVVHPLYYDYKLPDVTIAALLRAAELPSPSPREIKRLRTTYRRA